MPAVVEADDEGTYVLKFRGAGQGAKALIAELVAGELARAMGLPMPELVFADLDTDLARTEPDPEIQDLIRASPGLNLALDFLPGAATFDPLADRPDPLLASSVVWLDSLVSNVDRTPRNPNLLMWHRHLWLIDHGASLYFHHAPAAPGVSTRDRFLARSQDPFKLIKDHVLLPLASALEEADTTLAARLTPEVVQGIAALIPDEWLAAGSGGAPQEESSDALRDAYVAYFLKRLEAPRPFVAEAIQARKGGRS